MKTEINWNAVDWSQKDAVIVRQTGRSPATVSRNRKRIQAPRSPRFATLVTGSRFGKLVVKHSVPGKRNPYLVVCDCGQETVIQAAKLIGKNISACRIGGCCAAKGRKVVADRYGSNNPKWRGGQIKTADGRTLIYSPEHPYLNHSGIYVFRYRLVMEKKLGRFLLPDELVHHRDGDHTNDSPDNLELTDRINHGKIHNSSRTRTEEGRFEKAA